MDERTQVETTLQWNSRLAIGIAVTGFLLLGLMLMSKFGTMAWAVLLVAMAGCVLIGHPRHLLFFYWVIIVIYPYFSTLYSSTITKWSDEALALAMMGVLVMHHIQNRSILVDLKTVNRVCAALLGLILVSGIANQVPKILIIHFTLQYMRMFLLFYFAYVFIRARDLRTVFLVISGMVLLQYLMNFTWLLGINPLPRWMGGQDFAIGTGIGANVCAYYTILLICMLMAWFVASNRTAHRAWCAVLILLSLGHFFITFTFHAYMALPLCIGILILVARVNRVRVAVASVILAATVVVILNLLPSEYMSQVSAELNPRRLGERANSLRYGPKGQSYWNCFNAIPREIPYPAIGAGPGNAGSMVARINRRPLADRYFTWVDLSVESRNLSYGGSILGGPMTGIITLWSELGPLGAILYWGLHLYAVWWVWSGLRRRLYTNFYKIILAQAFVPMMVFYIALATLADSSWLVYMNAIWIWAGCVWRRDRVPTPQQPLPDPLVAIRRRRISAGA